MNTRPASGEWEFQSRVYRGAVSIQDGSSIGFNSCNPAEKLSDREYKNIAPKHRKQPPERLERRSFTSIVRYLYDELNWVTVI